MSSTQQDTENDQEEDVNEHNHSSIGTSSNMIKTLLTSIGPVVTCVLLRHMRSDGRDSVPHRITTPSSLVAPPQDETNTVTSTSEPKVKDTTAAAEHDTGHQHSHLVDPNQTRPVLTELIDEIQIDTTPAKGEVQQLFGGPFSFLGQYPSEGIICMARRPLPDDLHQLSMRQLQALCREWGLLETNGVMTEKGDMVTALMNCQLPINPHRLQPPLDKITVRGDILIMKVADEEEEEEEGEENEEGDDGGEGGDGNKQQVEKGEGNPDGNISNGNSITGNKDQMDEDTKTAAKEPGDNTNDENEQEGDEGNVDVLDTDEFFLSYTKEEYIQFASRTDVVAPAMDDMGDDEYDDDGEAYQEDGNNDDDDDEYNLAEEMDEEQEKSVMMNLVLGEVIRKFRERNGRGPNTEEVLELRRHVATELGMEVPLSPPAMDSNASSPKKRTGLDEESERSSKKVKFSSNNLEEDQIDDHVNHDNGNNGDDNSNNYSDDRPDRSPATKSG